MIGMHEIGYPDISFSIHDIRSIGRAKGEPGREERTITYADGHQREIAANIMGHILQRPVQLIPAAPGTFTLRVWLEGANGDPESGRTPVIAWALCLDGLVRPVTPQGVEDGQSGDAEVFVLMPDGSVQSNSPYSDDVFFESEGAYRAAIVATMRARHAGREHAQGERAAESEAAA